MKIWLLTTEFPPFFGGGISTYCLHTSKMLAENGHDVTVILPDSNLSIPFDKNTKEKITVYRFRPAQISIYRNLGYMAALSYEFAEVVEQLIRDEGAPDIIESQDYSGIAYFLLLRKKQLNPLLQDLTISINLHTPKFIVDDICQASVYKLPDFWIGEMERYCIQAADIVISPSQFLLDQLQKKYSLKIGNAYVIPNPYKAQSLLNEKKDKYISEEMVFFGRVQYHKGLDQLLRHLSYYWDEGMKLPLKVIGGDGFFAPKNISFTEYLTKKYKKYIDKGLINFTGLLNPKEAYEQMSEAKVIFVPSLFESFSYAVVEAMSNGKLVIASDSGGQREIIQNTKNGLLFEIENHDSFKQAFDHLLQLTDTEIINYGEEAVTRINDYCSYENVYKNKLDAWKIKINNPSQSRIYPFIREIKTKSNKNLANLPSVGSINEPDLLSIVIPYYNMGKWIQETLDSLISVNYTNYEIILINDGSTDEESIKKLEELKDKYPVKIISKNNGGLASARNEGVKYAKGEYLTFLDADDKVAPNYYTKAINILKAYDNVSFVGCWTQFFEGSENLWPTWNPEPPFFLVHNTVNSSALVYKKDDFVRNGLNDPDMVYGMEDYESAIRMVKANCRGVVITEPLFIYRIRADSMSRQFNPDNQNYLYRLITEKNSDFYNMYAKEIFNIVNNNGPAHLYDNPTWNLPPCGFVNINNDISNINFDTNELPIELKQKLMILWKNNKFKKILKLAMKLKLDKLFS